MEKIQSEYKKYFTDRNFVMTVVESLFFLFFSFVIEFYAGMWATDMASSPVRDLILSNIPVFDVDAIFIYGPLLLWIFVTILILREPNKIPFVLKSIALFIIIRSIFVTLTHIGPFPDQIVGRPDGWAGHFIFGGDLFFSAHTGLPFLLSLIFYENKFLRYLFVIVAIFFGTIVLLGHLHYSIDVVSAFFITYTIFHLAKKIFRRDWQLFQNS